MEESNIDIEKEIQLFCQVMDLEDDIKKEEEKIHFLQLNLEFLKKEKNEKREELNSILSSDPSKHTYFNKLIGDIIDTVKS
jgi:hypothetical protein